MRVRHTRTGQERLFECLEDPSCTEEEGEAIESDREESLQNALEAMCDAAEAGQDLANDFAPGARDFAKTK